MKKHRLTLAWLILSYMGIFLVGAAVFSPDSIYLRVICMVSGLYISTNSAVKVVERLEIYNKDKIQPTKEDNSQ